MMLKFVFVGVLAYCVHLYLQYPVAGVSSYNTIARGLVGTADSPRIAKKVAVGYNTNLDLIVSATSVLKALGDIPASVDADDCASVGNREEFLSCFLHFFSSGSAAERVVASSEFFKEIVDASKALPRKVQYIGGNAGLMATTFADFMEHGSKDVLLGGPVGPDLHALLDERIEVVSPFDSDEVHLILEYEKGEVLAGVTAPRANRFILHHDITNGELLEMPPFHKALQKFQPDVVVVSGLHLLDGFPTEQQASLVTGCREQMDTIARSATVHFELASMASVPLIQLIGDQILPATDSLGLNEQELESLVSSFQWNGPSFFPHSSIKSVPSVGAVVDALLFILEKMEETRLTRIHFHCLSYHVVAQRAGSWSSPAVPAAAASLGVTQRACSANFDKDLTPIVDLLLPSTFSLHGETVELDQTDPVHTWSSNGIEFALTPVLVCKHPEKTVGLGDSISATGLMRQERL